MRERFLILFVGISCTISWFLWSVVLILISPEELGFLSVFFFFATLGVAFFTSFLLFFYYIRIKILKFDPFYRQFHIIFRESLLVALWILGLLILSRQHLMSGKNFILSLAFIILIDFFLAVTYDKRRFKRT